MDQAVNTGQDADERTELGDGNDRSNKLAADGILGLELLPGVVLFLLVAEGNLLVLRIVALDVNLDGIADIDDLGGMLDVGPAQLADVAQTVHAADVNKGAVAGQALDHAGVLLANFNIGPELLALDLVLLGSDLVDAADDLAAGALGDDKADMLADQLGVILVTAHGSLAAGNKDADALDHNDNAALVGLDNVAFHDGAVLAGFGNVLHALLRLKTDAGQGVDAFLVVGLDDNQIQLVVDLDQILHAGGRIVGHLAQLDNAGVLGAVNADGALGGADADDFGFHDFTSKQGLCLRGLQHLGKTHVVTNFFTHTVKYLLNYRRRR